MNSCWSAADVHCGMRAFVCCLQRTQGAGQVLELRRGCGGSVCNQLWALHLGWAAVTGELGLLYAQLILMASVLSSHH